MMRISQILGVIIFLAFCSCNKKSQSNDRIEKFVLSCSIDSVFRIYQKLSFREIKLIANHKGWTISKGVNDLDSIYLLEPNGRVIFESKVNEFSNIDGYANIFSSSSECNVIYYFLNGEVLGPKIVMDPRSNDVSYYTFSSITGEVLFSYFQDGDEVEIYEHHDINPVVILYDGTNGPVKGEPFELNIYVPAPPGTRPILEFSLDSLFDKKSVHEPHPNIRELFTPEIYPEAAGTVEIYYRYSLFNELDSLLLRETIPLILTVGHPLITSNICSLSCLGSG